MHLLPCRVGARQHGPGLAEAEVEVSEQALALTYAELDSIGLVDPRRQRLAIPQVDPHSRVARLGPQHPINLHDLLLAQTSGSTGSFSFSQAAQSFPLVAVNPIFNRTRRVSQQSRDIWTRQTLRHEQDTMQPMIVPRLIRALNLLL